MSENSLYDCLIEVVKKRRSLRQLKSDPLPDEYVDKIVEVARWAPSGFHTQPWEIVVVTDEELKGKITEAIEGTPPVTIVPEGGQGGTSRPPRRAYYRNAPVFIIMLGDWRAKVGLPGSPEDQDRRVDNIFTSSLAGAFLQMHLAVGALGLASCWVSMSANPEPQRKIKEILGIPEALRIYDMMAIGYPDHPPVPKVIRKKEDVVHYNYCGAEDFRSDEEVVAEAEETRAWCISAH